MIGHYSRLRDVMGRSYPIYACTRANHARFSSVLVTFCGSWKHSLLEKITRQEQSVEHIEQYHIKFMGKSHYLNRRGRKAFVQSLFSRS